tara:strand:- start:43 stop:414 length:372 start_codon:yes stop_codon:yes gene_type:complete
LVSTILDHVAKHEGFIVAQEAFVNLGLNGAGEFLKAVFCIATLYFFEEPTRSARHSRTDHAFFLFTASYSKNRSPTHEISNLNEYLFIMNKEATPDEYRTKRTRFCIKSESNSFRSRVPVVKP